MREKDLREIMKQWFDKDIYWIEQSSGSSHGFPDSLISVKLRGKRKELIPVELKIANFERLSPKEPLNKLFKPTQLAMAYQLTQRETFAMVVFGDETTSEMYCCTVKQLSNANLHSLKLYCSPISSLHDFLTSLLKNI